MTERKKDRRESSAKPKKLRLNKETVKDLTAKEPDRIKGGAPKYVPKYTEGNPGRCSLGADC